MFIITERTYFTTLRWLYIFGFRIGCSKTFHYTKDYIAPQAYERYYLFLLCGKLCLISLIKGYAIYERGLRN